MINNVNSLSNGVAAPQNEVPKSDANARKSDSIFNELQDLKQQKKDSIAQTRTTRSLISEARKELYLQRQAEREEARAKLKEERQIERLVRQQEREDARTERREERQEARLEKQEAREAERQERQEARLEKQEAREAERQERQEARAAVRAENKAKREEARNERKQEIEVRNTAPDSSAFISLKIVNGRYYNHNVEINEEQYNKLSELQKAASEILSDNM